MTAPTDAALVRFTSKRNSEQFVLRDRATEFPVFDELAENHHLSGVGESEFGGFPLWRSPEDTQGDRASDLVATAASAYDGSGNRQVDVFEIGVPLHDSILRTT